MATMIEQSNVLAIIETELVEYEKMKASGESVPAAVHFFESLANKYKDEGMTFYKVKNLYYNKIKGSYDTPPSEEEVPTDSSNVNEPIKEKLTISLEDNPEHHKVSNEDTSTDEPTTEQKSYNLDENIENFIKQTTPTKLKDEPIYLPGYRIDVRVVAVKPYGAIVETLDSSKQGLIHISEIRNHFISDPNDYFEVGDIVQNARIVRIEKDGKMALSTLDCWLPRKNRESIAAEANVVYIDHTPINNPMVEKLVSLKEKYAETYSVLSKEPESFAPSTPEDEDLHEMREYIKGIVGVLSPQAEEFLKELKEKHKSVFKITRAILETEKDFAPDLGLLFVKQVDKKLSDGL
jgi:predicted RNA-binding protein with RPS1 domain